MNPEKKLNCPAAAFKFLMACHTATDEKKDSYYRKEQIKEGLIVYAVIGVSHSMKRLRQVVIVENNTIRDGLLALLVKLIILNFQHQGSGSI